jgi:hypothetical protein
MEEFDLLFLGTDEILSAIHDGQTTLMNVIAMFSRSFSGLLTSCTKGFLA